METGTFSMKSTGFKILVVEDSETERMRMVHIMEGEGYHVIEASSGNEAIEKSLSEKPSIIFMDIIMQDGDGYHACRRITENRETELIPVCMVSSKKSDTDMFHSLEVGAVTHYTKPYKADELLSMVSQEYELYERYASKK